MKILFVLLFWTGASTLTMVQIVKSQDHDMCLDINDGSLHEKLH